MVTVPAGAYQMGKNIDYGYGDMDGPTHTVTLNRAFALAANEVTLAEYRAFVRETRYVPERKCNVYKKDAKWYIDPKRSWDDPGFEQADTHPVVCVSWRDTQAYIRWLNDKTGRQYRLPSEAEWEYVAALADVGDSRAGGGVTHENANIGKPVCCGGETGGRDVWTYTRARRQLPGGQVRLERHSRQRLGMAARLLRAGLWRSSDRRQRAAIVLGERLSRRARRVVRRWRRIPVGTFASARDGGPRLLHRRLPSRAVVDPGAQDNGGTVTSAQIARPVVEMIEAMRQRNLDAVDRQLARSIDPQILYYWGETVSGRPRSGNGIASGSRKPAGPSRRRRSITSSTTIGWRW